MSFWGDEGTGRSSWRLSEVRVVREAPKKSSIASVEGRKGLAGRSEVQVNAREGRARGVVVYVPVIWMGCE